MRPNLAAAAAIAAALWIPAAARGGPLAPPAGPVSATHRTLTEVEPRTPISAATTPGDADSAFRISQPGSYYLTGNLTGVSGKSGIEIAASGVTIDLRGFTLQGAAGSLAGITAGGSLDGVTVLNGTVQGWGAEGVSLANVATGRCRVQGVTSLSNGSYGIIVGYASQVSACVAALNSSYGIVTGADCVVSGCTASNNNNTGFLLNSGCTIEGCAAASNGGFGINAQSGGVIRNCTAHENSGTGIVANVAATIVGCGSYINFGGGLSAASGTIADTTVAGNLGHGIQVTGPAVISGCTASGNKADGIRVGNDCAVRGNTCQGNGSGSGDGAGIHATSSDNRIEGNTCTDADRGIDADAGGNFIARNTCSGNTLNWDVAAGNTILVVQATSAGAVSGNTGGAAPGSTDPNANFTH